MGKLGIHFRVDSTKFADALDTKSEGKRKINQLNRQMVVSFMRWGRLRRRYLGEDICEIPVGLWRGEIWGGS